ncbi:MAG: S46 family peptidase [Gemmataceae bacterium]
MRRVLLAFGLVLVLCPPSPADEGMWLFNNPPRKILKSKYDFDITDDWLDHLQKSSVRFPHGSGSFVSADGLVMTNHHVASTAIQKLSTKDKDLLKLGFLAKSPAEELKCLGEELYVLMEIGDVTKEVKAAVTPDMKPAEAALARRAIINKIETEAQKKTGMHSEVVTLYQGNMYHLYRYKRYTDIRLVFAPEQAIAFFGGDADNFAYPRYDLDVTLFRVYEDGKPVKVTHFLKWNNKGVSDEELVFVSGHPGRTSRLNTVAELEYLRDKGYPYLLQRLNRWEVLASVFGGQGQEFERRAKDFMFTVANSRKARMGGLAGLQDPDMFAAKMTLEKKLRAAAAKLDSKGKDPWQIIAAAQKVRLANIVRHTVLEQAAGFNTSLFSHARTIVRAAEEYAKPNEKRLPEFSEANRKSLELALFSKAPIYDNWELAKLEDALSWMTEQLGYGDPLVRKILDGKSPAQRAALLVQGTKLFDPKERKRLYDGGKDAVAASKDTMIELARLVDPAARKVRQTLENEVTEPSRQAYDQIAQVKFDVEGTSVYPDATFTLRLSFGVVKGYTEGTKKIPFQTHIKGAYERSASNDNQPPYDLPESWLKHKKDINLKVPFNFVCTNDIIGGNSGSPVVNRKGDVVGLIFDGNIQSLVWDFVYTEADARSVAVCTQAITEALRSIYGGAHVADELISGGRK